MAECQLDWSQLRVIITLFGVALYLLYAGKK